MKIAVVVPTNRELIHDFLAAWEPVLSDRAAVIVMEDSPERLLALPPWVRHFSHAEARADLGDDQWIIPMGSSACRSYGTLKALELGADIIWHLDDDCRPEPGVPYLWKLARILSGDAPDPAWWNTLHQLHGGKIYPRGYPYEVRESRWPVMIHHGLWSHVPDLDGRTQLAMPDLRLWPAHETEVVPRGAFFPMCGMNLAFRREAAPLFYMGLQGGEYPFDRFDDIWAGLFAKRIADRILWAVTSGAPSVRHDRASDAERNARIEAPGIGTHELLWPYIAGVELAGHTAIDCYYELGSAVKRFMEAPYWLQLGRAMQRWAELTDKALG